MIENNARIWHDRSEAIVEVFPQYSEVFSDKLLQHVWRASEVAVEKDKHNLLVELPEADRHGILTVLTLFTQYEVWAGVGFWLERYPKIVKGPEFIRLATAAAMNENCSHKPFYQKINQVLGLDNEEFYKSYVNDPVLVERANFVEGILNHPNDMISLGGFSFVEGAILYSAFGFLKGFQANGRNDIKATVSGIQYSLVEEGLHSVAAATTYRHLEKECLEDGVYEERYGKREDVQAELIKAAKEVLAHETAIIDKIFEKGDIHGTSKQALIGFVCSRLNECLNNLDINYKFDVVDTSIEGWFYNNTTSFVMHDFFNTLGSQYTVTWVDEDFDIDNCEE